MLLSYTSWKTHAGGLLLALCLAAAVPAAAQVPAFQWGLQTTNPAPADGSPASINSVATDAAGRSYVGGDYAFGSSGTAPTTRTFGNVGTVGPGTGGLVAQAAPGGQWAWARDFVATAPTSGSRRTARVTSVVVAAGGEVYATGTVEGKGIAADGQTASFGGDDGGLFVARLSSAGAVLWLRVVAGTFTFPRLAAAPGAGGVVLADSYHGTPYFSPYALPNAPIANGYRPFVARLDAGGTWTAAVAATGSSEVFGPTTVAVGPTGQVALSGVQQSGTLTFGSFNCTVPAGIGGTDGRFFVAQLGPNNQWDWLASSTGGSNSSLYGASYTAAGALWVSGGGTAGTTAGPLVLLPPPASSPTDVAALVAQLSAAGQWTAGYALTPTTAGLALVVGMKLDAVDNPLVMGVIAAGATPMQLPVGGQVLSAPTWERRYFVAGLLPSGQWRYVATVPTVAAPGRLLLSSLAIDPAGNLYLTGSLQGSLALGSTTLTGSMSTNSQGLSSGGDAVLLKLTNAAPLAARAAEAERFAVFPSPAHGAATWRLPAPAATRETVALLDAQGRTARTLPVPVGATEIELDLTGLPPGLYLVRGPGGAARLMVE